MIHDTRYHVPTFDDTERYKTKHIHYLPHTVTNFHFCDFFKLYINMKKLALFDLNTVVPKSGIPLNFQVLSPLSFVPASAR